jgi:hypothetical protein
VRFQIMDTAPERYALNVASATAAVSGLQLAGAYLHGSAVLGGSMRVAAMSTSWPYAMAR